MTSDWSCIVSPDELDQYINLPIDDQVQHFKDEHNLLLWFWLSDQQQHSTVNNPTLLSTVKTPPHLPVFPRRGPSDQFGPAHDARAVDLIQDCSQPERPSPICSTKIGFGSTETASNIVYSERESRSDLCERVSTSSIIKPKKKKQIGTPPSIPQMNIDEWLVMDDNNRGRRRPLLYEFLRQLLDNHNYSDIAKYVNKDQGIFKFYQPRAAAELWQNVKGRNSDSSK